MRQLFTYGYLDVVARIGSIRKASEILAITSTALTRRILAVEEDLGVPIFERLPRGVRLNTAGEILIHHIRNQISDMERVKSQIADLSGIRRGHVNIACSQTLLPDFLPNQIMEYREKFPDVTFDVQFSDKAATEDALSDYSADMAIVMGPINSPRFEIIGSISTKLCAVMSKSHPLASAKSVSLNDCFKYDLALPPQTYGVREAMDNLLMFSGLKFDAKLVSDNFEFLRKCVASSNILSFGFPLEKNYDKTFSEIVYVPLSERNIPVFQIFIGQLKGRTLPVAVAKFSDQIVKAAETIID